MTSNLSKRVKKWFVSRPGILRKPTPDNSSNAFEFYETSDELINRIVRAIALNQSVVLSGPRGSGKSHCIRKAIRKAADEGILETDAFVLIQGNKELPRDYLYEDEITFVKEEVNGKTQVIPQIRSAPIFKYVKRGQDNKPLVKDNSREVLCEIEFEVEGQIETKSINKFVLFLDEINRFSDGVLDGLLLLMEEGETVLAGQLYKLPVVVCMTMNPPGYDSSARTLSPPLSARIGQSFRLSSPSLNTLTDIILPSTLNEIYKDESGPILKPILWSLVRKAALVTLCCWGNVGVDKAGLEYLTDDTKELLKEAIQADKKLEEAMDVFTSHCSYGPDARALQDWIKAAVGKARAEALAAGYPEFELTARDLIETARVSLSHKIQDNFSPTSRPDLLAEKEKSILELSKRILGTIVFERLLIRWIDTTTAFDGIARKVQVNAREIRGVFLASKLTNQEEVEPFIRLLETLGPRVSKIKLEKALNEANYVEIDQNTSHLVFNDSRYINFAQFISEIKENSYLSWGKLAKQAKYINFQPQKIVAEMNPYGQYFGAEEVYRNLEQYINDSIKVENILEVCSLHWQIVTNEVEIEQEEFVERIKELSEEEKVILRNLMAKVYERLASTENAIARDFKRISIDDI